MASSVRRTGAVLLVASLALVACSSAGDDEARQLNEAAAALDANSMAANVTTPVDNGTDQP